MKICVFKKCFILSSVVLVYYLVVNFITLINAKSLPSSSSTSLINTSNDEKDLEFFKNLIKKNSKNKNLSQKHDLSKRNTALGNTTI